MSGKSKGDRQAAADPTTVAAIEAEIERVSALGVEEVRALWRNTFKRDVPKALTRDLLVRMFAWHIQEEAFGGHSRAMLKILDSYAEGKQGKIRGARRLKPGTEIVREYQGERHTVVVTAGGFRWRDGDYPSLTAIARAITGTGWNGPRFFGLRVEGHPDGGLASPIKTVGTPTPSPAAKALRGPG